MKKGYAYFNTQKYGTKVTRTITVIDILMNPQKHNLCKNSLHNLGSGSISHTQVREVRMETSSAHSGAQQAMNA